MSLSELCDDVMIDVVEAVMSRTRVAYSPSTACCIYTAKHLAKPPALQSLPRKLLSQDTAGHYFDKSQAVANTADPADPRHTDACASRATGSDIVIPPSTSTYYGSDPSLHPARGDAALN